VARRPSKAEFKGIGSHLHANLRRHEPFTKRNENTRIRALHASYSPTRTRVLWLSKASSSNRLFSLGFRGPPHLALALFDFDPLYYNVKLLGFAYPTLTLAL
jgi:hypothetical protein